MNNSQNLLLFILNHSEMKRIKEYLILLCILLSSAKMFGQENWEYGTNIQKSAYQGKSLQALNSVTLLPGFQVAAGTTFSAQIYSPLDPDPVDLTQMNYVKTTILLKEGKKLESDVALTPPSDKMVSYNYEDGFGRTIQQVEVAASPLGFDMVQHYKYDKYGQQSTNYLPYVSTSINGSFQQDAITNQLSFYNKLEDKIANDTKPYATVTFNNSPIGRLIEQGGPGVDWQPGSGHTIKNEFRLNTLADQVWISSVSGFNGSYPEGTLHVSKITDENGNHVLEFTDKMGRKLLKRVQLEENIVENSSSNYVAYLETYYIYDDYGNLIYQVPPKASAKIKSGATWNNAFINEWVFEYKYDSLGRLISKNTPDSDPMLICYDQLDRPVFVQDGKLRTQQKWYFNKYDKKGRLVITGIFNYTDPGSQGNTAQEKLQNYLNSIDLNTAFYYEKKQTGTALGYSNQVYPIVGTEVLNAYYYDNYDFDADGNADYSYTAQSLAGEKTAPQGSAFNLPTGTKSRVLGSNSWTVSYTFYDHDGRVIQVRGNSHSSVIVDNLSTVVYNFTGQPVISKTTVRGAGGTVTNTRNRLEYAHHGRLSKIYQVNNTSAEQLIGQYEYNELGQLVDKKLHGAGMGFLQSVDYRYNIRGWLTHINNSTLSADENNDESNDLFGMEFLYNKVQTGLNNQAGDKINWNGAVSAVKWKVQATGTHAVATGNPLRERSYKFAYDKANRLTAASYQAFSGTGWDTEVGGYDESATYDHNGNILTLKRYNLANQSTQRTLIDDLLYSYTAGLGNKLKKVEDVSNNSMGFTNGTNTADEYGYNENGSLTRDDNKAISQIIYNDIGKAEEVLFTDGRKIVYIYNGMGIRLQKKIFSAGSSTPIKIFDYIGSFVYENSSLSYFRMPEGRVRSESGNFIYEYFISDNQGNTRVSFDAWENGGTVVARLVQENHYYPFGMSMKGMVQGVATPSSANKNLYNAGSELQDDYSDEPNWYSMYYRDYDPVLGRMNGVDPLADKYASYTPYNFAFNNPIMFNDPSGADNVYIGEGSLDVTGWNGSVQELVDHIMNDSGIQYGYSWNQYEGGHVIESLDEAFAAGAQAMDKHDMWGRYDFAESYEDASYAFASWTSSGSIQFPDYVKTDNKGQGFTYKGGTYDLSGTRQVLVSGKANSGGGDVIDNFNTALGIFSLGQGQVQFFYEATVVSETSATFSKMSNVSKLRSLGRSAGVLNGLQAVGKVANYAAAGVVVGKVLYNQSVQPSDILDGVIGVASFIPGGGWAIGGAYLIGDFATKSITGQSIGNHLNDYYGNTSLVSWK
jgi:RHS repeat-associated protein